MNELFEIECKGGGRIEHINTEDEKKIEISDYSKGYGKADHKKTADIISEDYRGYSFKWSET